MNCATTNADPLKIRVICVIRVIHDLRRTRKTLSSYWILAFSKTPNAICIQTMAGHRDPRPTRKSNIIPMLF